MDEEEYLERWNLAKKAQSILDITIGVREDLFFPMTHHILIKSKKKAAAVVRHLAKFGEVDWSVADNITEGK